MAALASAVRRLRPTSTPRPGASTRHHARGRGQALVEFALVLPVMLLVLLMAIDFGRLFFSLIQINNAAREGAAYAATQPAMTDEIKSHAIQETDAQGQGGESPLVVDVACLTPPDTSIDCADAAGGAGIGNQVVVSVSERFTFFTPLVSSFFGGGLDLSSSATSAVLVLAASHGGSGSTCSAPPDTPTIEAVGNGLLVNVDGTKSTPTSGACQVIGYDWDFGDPNAPIDPDTGLPADTGQGATTNYTYSSSGTYTITLTTRNAGPDGSNTATTTQQITVTGTASCVAPTASFTISPGPYLAYKNKNFPGTNIAFDGSGSTNMTDLGCNPEWTWDFDNGTVRTFDDPSGSSTSYTYDSSGSYDVKLTVQNDAGSSSKTVHISVSK